MANTLTKSPIGYINFEKRYYVSASTSDEYHENPSEYLDNRGRWDDRTSLYGSDLPISNRDKAMLYIVPVPCKLKGFHGISSTFTSSGVHTVSLWHGTPTLEAASSTTMTLACSNASTHNTRFHFEDMSATCDISLAKGDGLLFTVKRGVISTQTYIGTLTCLMEV